MKKYKKWLLHEFRKLPCEVQRGHGKVKVVDILPLIDQLDEPEKIEPLVVPKYLGEWLAKQSLGNEKNLFGIIGGLEDMWVRGDFEEFIDTNKKELIEVILGTKPYEVEKEKLYYVLDKQGKTLLVLMGGEVRISGGYVLSESTANKEIFQLTEKQIKDYDERFWQFAVGVVE